MPIFRRREQSSNEKQPSSLPTSVGITKHSTRKWCGLKRRIQLWVAGCSTILAVYYFVLDEYAWVHVRCLKTWFRPFDTVTGVVCVEAATNKRAAKDSSLWDLQAANYLDVNTTQAVNMVHYTVTTPLQGNVLDLALCSMEVSGRMCKDVGCVINVWIVDKANDHSLHNNTWFEQMQSTLESYQHCFRVVAPDATAADTMIGSACLQPKPCAVAQSLRQWLSSPLAQNQLPAHVSDAWRLVALHEFGGLYLDADVLPISMQLFHLPSSTIPAQDKVGAYRLNGGTLRMSGRNLCNHDDDESSASFFELLVTDHLEWAPRLARLPQTLQTFGFLGPCALTRVYTRHDFTDAVTILPPELVEPAIDGDTICQGHPLAIHFSGKKKRNWKKIMMLADRRGSKSCLQNVVHAACPQRVKVMEQAVSP